MSGGTTRGGTTVSHDWTEAFRRAAGVALPNGDDPFFPWAYRRPDGTAATVGGSRFAVLVVSGEHAPMAPDGYENRDPKTRRPSGKAVDALTGADRAAAGEATAADWRAAVGEPFVPPKPAAAVCPECDGTGRADCPHCEQEMDCEGCGGKGKTAPDPEWPAPVLVQVGGVGFDRRFLAPLLALVPDGPVMAAVGGGALRLSGDGWVVLCNGYDVGFHHGDDPPATVEVPLLAPVPA
jgi:hypothetical protein